jgi:hypothetical protein
MGIDVNKVSQLLTQSNFSVSRGESTGNSRISFGTLTSESPELGRIQVNSTWRDHNQNQIFEPNEALRESGIVYFPPGFENRQGETFYQIILEQPIVRNYRIEASESHPPIVRVRELSVATNSMNVFGGVNANGRNISVPQPVSNNALTLFRNVENTFKVGHANQR